MSIISGASVSSSSFGVLSSSSSFGVLSPWDESTITTFPSSNPTPPMTKTSYEVRTATTVIGVYDTEDKALDAAQEYAQKHNETVFILKPVKVVKPKREVTVETL